MFSTFTYDVGMGRSYEKHFFLCFHKDMKMYMMSHIKVHYVITYIIAQHVHDFVTLFNRDMTYVID